MSGKKTSQVDKLLVETEKDEKKKDQAADSKPVEKTQAENKPAEATQAG